MNYEARAHPTHHAGYRPNGLVAAVVASLLGVFGAVARVIVWFCECRAAAPVSA